MKWQHLLYLIPITIIISLFIGLRIGIVVGIESVDAFEELACQTCADGLQFCTNMMQYMSAFNGTTEEAFKSYAFNNSDEIMALYEKYS